VPEQNVADGAATARGDTAEHHDAEPAHAAPPRRQRCRHRLRGDCNEQQDMQDRVGGGKVHIATSCRIRNPRESQFHHERVATLARNIRPRQRLS
jgi:hypothetical protein